MSPQLFIVDPLPLIFTALGLVVGSYLNVVAYRVPAGISTVWPGSRCPRCLLPIRPYHNVPVLGWVLLGGCCRDCRVPISPRYPLVEATTGLLFLLCVLRFRTPASVLIAAAFLALLLALALIDFDHRVLPRRLTLPGIAAAIAVAPWWQATTLAGSVIGAAVGWLLVAVPSALWSWRSGAAGFGAGDRHLAALIGAFLGWRGALGSFFLGCLAALLYWLLLRLAARIPWPAGWRLRATRELRRGLPFGSFLALGAAAMTLRP